MYQRKFDELSATLQQAPAEEILLESKDAYDGPNITLGLAQIYAWTKGQR